MAQRKTWVNKNEVLVQINAVAAHLTPVQNIFLIYYTYTIQYKTDLKSNQISFIQGQFTTKLFYDTCTVHVQ